MEATPCAAPTRQGGSATNATARTTASVCWLKTITARARRLGSGGGVGANTRTDGTQTHLHRGPTSRRCCSPFELRRQGHDIVMTGAATSRCFSTFTGAATRSRTPRPKKIPRRSVDADESDFGTRTARPQPFPAERDVLALQREMWAVPISTAAASCPFPHRPSRRLRLEGDPVRIRPGGRNEKGLRRHVVRQTPRP